MKNEGKDTIKAEFSKDEMTILQNSVAVYINYLEDNGEKFKQKHTDTILLFNRLTLLAEGIDISTSDSNSFVVKDK